MRNINTETTMQAGRADDSIEGDLARCLESILAHVSDDFILTCLDAQFLDRSNISAARLASKIARERTALREAAHHDAHPNATTNAEMAEELRGMMAQLDRLVERIRGS